MSDIEKILEEAEARAFASEIEALPELPNSHPDAQEFDQCLDKCVELAKKNGWVFYASHIRCGIDRDGDAGMAQQSRSVIDGTCTAKVFAPHGMNGVLAAKVYTEGVAHLIRFHRDIVPALFKLGKDTEDSED